MKNEFVLPENWVVKDCEFVTEYYNNTFGQNAEVDIDKNVYFFTFMDDKELFWEWVHKNDVKANGYKIITLSQFKKYVLGLKPEINKKDNFKYLLHFIKEINKKNEK